MFNKEMVFRATRCSRSVDLMLSRKIRSLSRVLSLSSSSSSSSAKRRVVSQSVRVDGGGVQPIAVCGSDA